jgi:hypothetical protein
MRSLNDDVPLETCNDIDWRGYAMTQAVCGRSLTAEARVQSQGSPCCTLWFGFPLSLSFHQCSTLIHSSPTDATGIAIICTDSLTT